MERPQTLLLPELSFPQLVKLFNDASGAFPITDLRVPHLLEHDIIRVRTDEKIALVVEVLHPERSWVYAFMEFEDINHYKVIRKLEEIFFPEHLGIRSPLGFLKPKSSQGIFKKIPYQHIPARITEIDLFFPEHISEDFFKI